MSLSEEDTESPTAVDKPNVVGDPELRSYVAFQDDGFFHFQATRSKTLEVRATILSAPERSVLVPRLSLLLKILNIPVTNIFL